MIAFLLDAPALLPVMCEEQGRYTGTAQMVGALMSMVKAIRSSPTAPAIRPIALTTDLALVSARPRALVQCNGLSLVARACVASASREGASVLTAERMWSTRDLGCTIELMR